MPNDWLLFHVSSPYGLRDPASDSSHVSPYSYSTVDIYVEIQDGAMVDPKVGRIIQEKLIQPESDG